MILKTWELSGLWKSLNIFPFFRLRDYIRRVVEKEKPDVFVCVDYPGFNMKLAHMVSQMGIPVVYYIAPTIWAWKQGRQKYCQRCGLCSFYFSF